MWRLHPDPAVLTPGRFYFAPPGTPASPVGTLRGSKNYVAEDGRAFLEWGQIDGPTKYDKGAPPIFLPLPRLVGTSLCLEGEVNDKEAAPAGPDSFRTVCIGGRDYRFPTIIYVSFSVAYGGSTFTYYNDVELILRDAMCEARYEGPTDIPNTKAIVRVTDVPDGSLATNFYLCDSTAPIPPVTTLCCPSDAIAGNLFLKLRVGYGFGGVYTWSKSFTNIGLNYNAVSTYWETDPDDPNAAMSIGKVRFSTKCTGGGLFPSGMSMFLDAFARVHSGDPLSWLSLDFRFFVAGGGLFTCAPFALTKGLSQPSSIYFGDFDGMRPSGMDVWLTEWEISTVPF